MKKLIFIIAVCMLYYNAYGAIEIEIGDACLEGTFPIPHDREACEVCPANTYMDERLYHSGALPTCKPCPDGTITIGDTPADHDSIDELERDAADFLIANMKWHDTEVILPSTSADALEEIYSGIDSVIYINACRNVMEVRNDVADTDTLPEPITFSSHIVLDCQVLNSSLLIKQIENQFRLWKSKSDVTNVSFDDFCEYLLPYTSHTCPLLLPLQQRSLHDFLDSYKDDFEIQEFAD